LAQRSAEAAKEIKSLIGTSVDKVEDGSRLVADAGQTMKEIVGSVQRVSDIIGEITASAAEQSDGIGHVNGVVVQLDQMTQQNAALVEQSAAAAESLKEQAAKLAEVVSTFKVGGPNVERRTEPVVSFVAVQPVAQPAAKAAVAAAKPAAAAAPKTLAKRVPALTQRVAAAKHPATSVPTPAASVAASTPVATAPHDDDWTTF
ncbi:MAG TPA: methyl-accepting chemotaxis protein, partial [Burkholderiaceae bacterium]